MSRWKDPCLHPLPDGRRCCECETCHPVEPPVSALGVLPDLDRTRIRPLEDIAATGAAWLFEYELAWLVGVAKALEEIARDYHCVITAPELPPLDYDGPPDADIGKHLDGCVGCFAAAALAAATSQEEER